ncbi:hypothetical protein DSL64_11645 [Dyadobacter luteus]|uniref:TonB C-terminal domain-containing protein n=1 Tax=Dyadobacter luteus TaxID=2259619 RepID=A0A3D8YBT0_9BACT|nr:hypothetical protein DSL64_11645 [Dyadobacter luteus]
MSAQSTFTTVLIINLIYNTNLVQAQSRQKAISQIDSVSTEKPYWECVLSKSPEFPGGHTALQKFIHDNLVSPQSPGSLKLPGRVFMSFIINEDGSLSDIRVLKGLSPQHDLEATKIIKLMPRWKPGRYRHDEISKIRYNLPILFP